ncbi:MAG: hypothetical protein ACXVPU_05560 [Bacteroidia bacterium]
MKKTFSLLIIVSFLFFACSTKAKKQTDSQNDFASLDSLIKQLDGKWELKETGKAYWIGYTDLMYKIASRKDTAIDRLVVYINSTKNDHGKIGGVLCLHLIGIDSKVIGRFQEEFKNKKAREALLNLVSQKEINPLVISLLARDPWPSDLPVLKQALESGTNKTLVNALFRYFKKDMPFRDSIPENTESINIVLQNSAGTYSIGKVITVYSEKEDEPQYPIKGAFSGSNQGNSIGVSGNGLTTNKANQLNDKGDVFIQFTTQGRIVRKFIPNKAEIKKLQQYFDSNKNQIIESKCEKLNQCLYDLFRLSKEKVSVFSYCNLNDSLFHYSNSSNKITICDLKTAQDRWINYLKQLDDKLCATGSL